ncbi:MAG: amidohydrolase [Gammaproteobacteria bacterium]|nr:amidohydrolase [Gammaproteobacteria bacterium]
MPRHLLLSLALLLAAGPALAADKDATTLQSLLKAREAGDAQTARQIWEWAEIGFQEEKSSALLQKQLTEAGFSIKPGVAAIPTAFVAEWGSGKPVIAIMAEMDALPGITQDAKPERSPLRGKLSGHACGHNLFGTASTSAAIAIKQWLEKTGRKGTIRLLGTPAEEGGSGKVYMVRAGLFDDVDVAMHWHAGDRNSAAVGQSLSNKTAKFRFYGISSHASAAPDRGRSALDGVEAMDMMANMMREHIPFDARMHYVITSGGSAPNVVPDFAESYYYVRHADPRVVADIFDRVVKASEGAALGTGTRVEHEVVGGVYSLLANDSLGKLMDRQLRTLGGVRYTAEERQFAEKIFSTLGKTDLALGSEAEVQPYDATRSQVGSTDVGDVSWVVPTVGLRTATWVPGTAAHSWQAVAAGGMSIGYKGMNLAAQALALTAMELYRDPKQVAAARREFEQRRGADFKYVPILGDRAPALDYRR